MILSRALRDSTAMFYSPLFTVRCSQGKCDNDIKILITVSALTLNAFVSDDVNDKNLAKNLYFCAIFPQIGFQLQSAPEGFGRFI